MKIGILTHYIHYGYGGVMQNYALQAVLKSLNQEPVTLRCAWGKKTGLFTSIRNRFSLLAHALFKVDTKSITKKQDAFISKEVEPFIERYIKITPAIDSAKAFLNAAIRENCEALVVGSDQIWRNGFPYLEECYLNFAQDLGVKKIAYAASFAVDEWEYDRELTFRCSSLAKLFDAISVREQSAIHLCKEYLGVESELVLDPTMLLAREDYIKLFEEAGERQSEGDLFSYILDNNPNKEEIINEIAQKLNKRRYECMPEYETSYLNIIGHPQESVYPPVTKWLRSFYDAECVVTDSFHGTVFSIIFNKPFYVLVNNARGAARFSNLLGMFGLEHRMISDADSDVLAQPIDWERVNMSLGEMKTKSLSFLRKALCVDP